MKLYETLEKQLKNEPNFVTDNGELKKWVAINKAQNFDAELIELLLESTELKEKFFVEVKGTLVFNQNLFVQFLEQKNYLNDSYTQFKNKVGLTIDGKYLKQLNEVALVWPLKIVCWKVDKVARKVEGKKYFLTKRWHRTKLPNS